MLLRYLAILLRVYGFVKKRKEGLNSDRRLLLSERWEIGGVNRRSLAIQREDVAVTVRKAEIYGRAAEGRYPTDLLKETDIVLCTFCDIDIFTRFQKC